MIIVAPFAMGPVCVNKVIIWDREVGPEGSTRVQEALPFCPFGLENESLYFMNGMGINYTSDSFHLMAGELYQSDRYATPLDYIHVRADNIELNF